MVINKTHSNLLMKDPALGFPSSCMFGSVSRVFPWIQAWRCQLPCWGSWFFLLLLWLSKAVHHHFYSYGSFPHPAGTTLPHRRHWGSVNAQRVKILLHQSLQILFSPSWGTGALQLPKLHIYLKMSQDSSPVCVTLSCGSFHFTPSDISTPIIIGYEQCVDITLNMHVPFPSLTKTLSVFSCPILSSLKSPTSPLLGS